MKPTSSPYMLCCQTKRSFYAVFEGKSGGSGVKKVSAKTEEAEINKKKKDLTERKKKKSLPEMTERNQLQAVVNLIKHRMTK